MSEMKSPVPGRLSAAHSRISERTVFGVGGEADDGYQAEEEGKEGKECVVGDTGGHVGGVVVAKFLDGADHQCRDE